MSINPYELPSNEISLGDIQNAYRGGSYTNNEFSISDLNNSNKYDNDVIYSSSGNKGNVANSDIRFSDLRSKKFKKAPVLKQIFSDNTHAIRVTNVDHEKLKVEYKRVDDNGNDPNYYFEIKAIPDNTSLNTNTYIINYIDDNTNVQIGEFNDNTNVQMREFNDDNSMIESQIDNLEEYEQYDIILYAKNISNEVAISNTFTISTYYNVVNFGQGINNQAKSVTFQWSHTNNGATRFKYLYSIDNYNYDNEGIINSTPYELKIDCDPDEKINFKIYVIDENDDRISNDNEMFLISKNAYPGSAINISSAKTDNSISVSLDIQGSIGENNYTYIFLLNDIITQPNTNIVNNTFTFDGLSNNTQYNIKIAAYNQHDLFVGDDTLNTNNYFEYTVTTYDTTPEFYVEPSSTHNSITFTIVYTVRGNSLQYKVWEDGENEPGSFEDESNLDSFTVSVSKADTDYKYKIRSINSNSNPTFFDVSGTQRTSSGTPETISGITVSDVTKDSFKISWNEPGNRGDNIIEYIIQYDIDGDDSEDLNTNNEYSTTSTEFTLTSLPSYTDIHYRVCAVNSNGRGNFSSNRTEKTDSDIPEVPSVSEDNTYPSVDTIRWRWNLIPDPNNKGLSIEYDVYGGVNSDSLSRLSTGTWTITYWDQGGLAIGDNYYIKVRTILKDNGSIIKESEFSSTVRGTVISHPSLGSFYVHNAIEYEYDSEMRRTRYTNYETIVFTLEGNLNLGGDTRFDIYIKIWDYDVDTSSIYDGPNFNFDNHFVKLNEDYNEVSNLEEYSSDENNIPEMYNNWYISTNINRIYEITLQDWINKSHGELRMKKIYFAIKNQKSFNRSTVNLITPPISFIKYINNKVIYKELLQLSTNYSVELEWGYYNVLLGHVTGTLTISDNEEKDILDLATNIYDNEAIYLRKIVTILDDTSEVYDTVYKYYYAPNHY